MTDPLGLAWLADVNSLSIGLVFVRGLSPDDVFRAYGADPAQAVERGPDEPYDPADGPFAGPSVRVGQAGDWVMAVEDHFMPFQAARSEVLRRASAGGEAVAVSTDIGKLNHTYGYAVAGDVVATLMTCVPLSWGGSGPGRLEPLARELGLVGDGAEPPDAAWSASCNSSGRGMPRAGRSPCPGAPRPSPTSAVPPATRQPTPRCGRPRKPGWPSRRRCAAGRAPSTPRRCAPTWPR